MTIRVENLTASQAEDYRLAAEELLAEAITRGDQDMPTVTWAVAYLLRRTDSPNFGRLSDLRPKESPGLIPEERADGAVQVSGRSRPDPIVIREQVLREAMQKVMAVRHESPAGLHGGLDVAIDALRYLSTHTKRTTEWAS